MPMIMTRGRVLRLRQAHGATGTNVPSTRRTKPVTTRGLAAPLETVAVPTAVSQGKGCALEQSGLLHGLV
jgi:hypothetical protein